MRRALAVLLLLSLAVASASYGASARWNALGNDHRFMYDTSNYGIYPGLMYKFSDALWIIPASPATAAVPNNMMAGLLVKNGDWAWAVHYNLPGTVAFNDLRSALTAAGAGATLNAVGANLRPAPDFYLAKKQGDAVYAGRVVLGLAGNEPVADQKASAMSIDLAGGMSKPTGMGDLDLGVRISSASFKDDSVAPKLKSTGGMGLHVDARLWRKADDITKRIALVGLRYKTLPVVDGANEITNTGVTVGYGMNRTDKEKRMLVAGVVLDVDMQKVAPPAGGDVKATMMKLTYLTGYEYPLNSWLVARGGANAALSMTSGDNPGINGTKSDFYYNFGVRGIYKKVLLDLIFDRAVFQRGPYILSGSPADLSTNVCLTYLF